MDAKNSASDKDFIYEKKHLVKVIDKIDQLSLSGEKMKTELRERIREERARIWEDYSRGAFDPSRDLQDVVQISQTEMRDSQSYENALLRAENLKLQRSSPYFARLNFKEDGEEAESFYIGYISLIDHETSELYICDWRADISSIFYDSELGRAFYSSPVGRIEGELTLRRQFKIEDSELIYMFDSDIAIEDDILKEELGKTADLKLKTIVTTIQKEQNSIIRDLSADLLLVQGCAGSGKTSVALHRLAYLLYKFRNTLSSVNVLIFSPNNVFNAYISDVLPELGEDRVNQKSFYDLFAPYFSDCRFESYVDQTERILKNEKSGESELNRIKGSFELSEAIKNYFNENNSDYVSFNDIVFDGKILLGSEAFRNLYCKDFASYTPEQRIGKIVSIVMEDFENDCKKIYLVKFAEMLRNNKTGNQYTDDELRTKLIQEWDRAKRTLEREIRERVNVNIYNIYLNVLASFVDENKFAETEKALKIRKLSYADIFPLTYLKILTGEIPPMRKINQIVIDEAQDYPPAAFCVINEVFTNAKLTILGDIGQRTTETGIDIKKIADFFPEKKGKYFELSRSYRSTSEINTYLQSVNGSTKIDYLDRHGEDVDIYNDFTFEKLSEVIRKLRSQNLKSIAVICCNSSECKEIKENISELIDADLISEDDTVYPGTTVVIPSYLTKGLEFDAAIVLKNNRFNESDFSRYYYVACSRALHKLVIFEKD